MLQTRRILKIGFPVKLALFFAVAIIALGACESPARAQTTLDLGSYTQRILLPEAARHFDIDISWKPAERRLSLTRDDRKAEILIGGDRLIVDGYLMTLSSPVSASDGSVTIALTDASELFSRLLGRTISKTELAGAGLFPKRHVSVPENNLIKSVRYISYPRFTRIIINVSGEGDTDGLDVKSLEGVGALTFELPNSRFVQPNGPIEVRDKIVEVIEQVQTSSDAKLIVKTVTDEVDYEIQKHNDPPRVVLDIRQDSPVITRNFITEPVLPTRTRDWIEPPAVDPRENYLLTTVVIDPGHGGKDHGAQGRGGLLEKDVTLGIALKLKELVEETAGMKVVLTRTGDYFVSLKERTSIANHAKDGMPADLFISIHTNAHKSPRVGGFEAFYISDAIDQDAEATAALENAVINFERNMDEPIEDSLAPILWDLQFTEFVSQSSELAFIAQEELGRRLNTRNRGVRQAQFIVLAGVAMPSILVEVGFISNRVEEAKLKTADFRGKCAEALAATVVTVKERHDIRLGRISGKSSP